MTTVAKPRVHAHRPRPRSGRLIADGRRLEVCRCGATRVVEFDHLGSIPEPWRPSNPPIADR